MCRTLILPIVLWAWNVASFSEGRTHIISVQKESAEENM